MTMIDKRTVKRVLAGLTAAASLATGGIMAGTAMAAETAVKPNTGADSPDTTITLQASVDTAFKNGDKFDKTPYLKAYQLATFNGGTTNDAGDELKDIDVTTNAAYTEALKAALGGKLTDASNPITDVMKLTGDVKGGKPAYASDLRNFVTNFVKNDTAKAAFAADAGVKSGEVNPDDPKQFQFTGLTPGYYLILDTSPKGMSAAVPMLAGTKVAGLSFDKENPAGVVYYKSIDDDTTGGGQNKPDPTDPDKNNPNVQPPAKEFENADKTHAVGDYVQYTVTQKVPNTTGYPGYRLNLVDTLGTSLKYVNDDAHPTTIKVTKDGKDTVLAAPDKGGQYYSFAQSDDPSDKAADQRVLTWEFGKAFKYTPEGGAEMDVRNILADDATKELFGTTPYKETTITITYFARITSDIKETDGLKNTIFVDYSNNPNAWGDQLGHQEGGDNHKPGDKPEVLTGAVVLHSVDNNKKQLTVGTNYQIKADGKILSFVKSDDGLNYVLADDDDKTAGKTVKDTIAVPANKDVTVDGLGTVDYQVVEVAPFATGFSTVTTADFKFTTSATKDKASGAITKTATLKSTAAGADNLHGLAYAVDGSTNTIGIMHVQNLAQLPATGSTMTVILGVMSAIVAAGFAVAYTKSRQRA